MPLAISGKRHMTHPMNYRIINAARTPPGEFVVSTKPNSFG